MIFGISVPTAEEWLILERMRNGERLYLDGVTGNPQTDPFTWEGNLSNAIDIQGTHLGGRELNSMRGGEWIVYDPALNQCVLTHKGNQALRLYRPSTRSNRCVTKKKSER